MSSSDMKESKIMQTLYNKDDTGDVKYCNKDNFSSLMKNYSLITSQNPFFTNSKCNDGTKYESVEDKSCGCNCFNNNNVVLTIGSGSAENSWSLLTSIKDKISDIWDYITCKNSCCVCDETEIRLGDEINSQPQNKRGY